MGKLGTYERTVEIDGKILRFESGKLARQAGGAVVASMGDTTVLTTTTASGSSREHLDFFPLTVDVEERMYAAGKIPGGFFKREGRPSENAILTARLIDRPLRPTFADGLRNEIQVVNTVLQTGLVDPYDVVAINASSLATLLAGVPFDGPVAGVRYAMLRDGSWVAFPTFQQLDDEAVFQMVVAGRVAGQDGDGDVAILMVEADAPEHAWRHVEAGGPEPTEERIGEAIESVKPILRALCEAQQAFVDEVGVRAAGDFRLYEDYSPEVYELVERIGATPLRDAYTNEGTKQERAELVGAVREETLRQVLAEVREELGEDELNKQARQAFRSLEKRIVREMITRSGTRVDGRSPREIRPVSAEVGVLDRVHGSSIFQRGETQVVNILALGMLRESQRLDTLHPEEEKRYIHHYNMPPYSTGEVGRIGSPKRREIGHGLLAERALLPAVPDEEEWPYAIRLVSEVVGSNGSTSMAAVCASTLSLMDGGVPIRAPVAGIAMGLIHEGGHYTTLTDIQGVEDFFGDMDFKVAGTERFVTALQLDTKLSGIPSDVLSAALLQAREARLAILEVMTSAIGEPRPHVKATAPQVTTITIPSDKIGELIGPKGKVIREITEETGADIDVEDDGARGVVRIYASSRDQAQAAADRVNAIANPTIPKEGERYHGTIVKTMDFGAFVSLTPGVDGLLHISKIGQKAGRRLEHAEEAVNVGEKVWVEVKEVRPGGKYSLDYVEGGEGSDGTSREEQPATSQERRPPPASEAPSDRSTPTVGEPSTVGERDRGGDRRERRERERAEQRSSSLDRTAAVPDREGGSDSANQTSPRSSATQRGNTSSLEESKRVRTRTRSRE
ncbi:MAG: polyribonucleotide nucleotidyltransferase [Nitriliruptorales bacterium]